MSKVISSSPYIEVIQDAEPYIVNVGGDLVGTMRYNTTTQTMEAFDGYNWIDVGNTSYDVGLTVDTEELLEWARSKRDADNKMQALAAENKAVQIALDNLKEAEDRLTVTAHLARTHEQTTS